MKRTAPYRELARMPVPRSRWRVVVDSPSRDLIVRFRWRWCALAWAWLYAACDPWSSVVVERWVDEEAGRRVD